MKILALSSLALGSLAVSAGAQSVDVTSSDRAVEFFAYGYDYEFDDGFADAQTTAVDGTWDVELVGDFDDYYGQDVADGVAAQSSRVTGQLLQVDLAASATISGSLFQSDSASRSSYTASFTAPVRQRYFAQAAAETDYGYNLATVGLQGPGGDLFSLDASYGESEVLLAFGWIDAGDYSFAASIEAAVGGSSGAPQTQAASASAVFLVFDAADTDFDGQVTVDDAILFANLLIAGLPFADINGDGALDLADWDEYVAAWFA